MAVPLVAAAGSTVVKGVTSVIKNIFGSKSWDFGVIASANLQHLGGFFNVLHYCGADDRIKYWLDIIASTKGVGIDSDPNYIAQIHTETVTLAYNKGLTSTPGHVSFTPGSIGQALYEAGEKSPVSSSGGWTPPALPAGISASSGAGINLAGLIGGGTLNIIIVVLLIGVLIFMIFSRRR